MNSRKLIVFAFAVFMLPCLARGEIPQHDQHEHLGVQSCGASSCHGSAGVRNTYAVLQNEYITWARHDLHARAYNVLKNEQSRRIATNLGLEAAHTAKICLDCHTDNVPPDRRGLQFQLSDGVSCEACHGGAGQWLGVHIGGGGDKHAESLAAGMYPTEDPEARAELCLSCHLGTRDKFATHEIMGAGHPRLSFDLQKFTDIQPRHYRVDKDYRARKNHVEETRAWAIGQVSASRQYLSLLQGPRMAGAGMFPELGLFDCHACHHSFKEQRWQANERTAAPPGTVLLNDSSLAMSHIIATVVSPGVSNSILSAIRELHLASQTNVTAVRAAAASLDRQLEQLAVRLKEQQFGRKRNGQIIDALAEAVREGSISDYSDAEQVTMALDVYSGITGKYKNEVDGLYDTVTDVDVSDVKRFDPLAFAAVFRDGSVAAAASVTRPPERTVQRPAPVTQRPERQRPVQRPPPVRQQPEPVVEQPPPVRQQPQRIVEQPAPVAREPERLVEQAAPAVQSATERSKPVVTTPVEVAGLQSQPVAATHIVNVDAIRVRFRPESTAGVRGLLYFGDELQLLNRNGEWSRVTYMDANGVIQKGWVASRLIVDRSAVAQRPPAKPVRSQSVERIPPRTSQPVPQDRVNVTHRINADVLRVRITPDTSAGVRGLLYFGDEVQLLNQSGDWSRITYTDANGVIQRGWIASSYLDPI